MSQFSTSINLLIIYNVWVISEKNDNNKNKTKQRKKYFEYVGFEFFLEKGSWVVIEIYCVLLEFTHFYFV